MARLRDRGWRYWRNLGLFLLTVTTLAAVGLAAGVAWMQVDAFLHPRRLPPLDLPSNRGAEYRDVTFVTSDGVTLRGWYLPSHNGAAIILGHGFGSRRRLKPALVLANHDYGVLTFDFRAHGESGGEMSSLGYYEVRDVEAALAWLQAQPDIDAGRIGMLGESMGAVTAIRAAARLQAIQAVVVECPFADLEESIRNIWTGNGLPAFPMVPLQIALGEWLSGLDLEDIQPLADVAEISPRPILIMTGGQDPITGPDAGQRYLAAAGEPKELWFEPELAHIEFLSTLPDEYERRVVGFFDAALLDR